MGTEGRPGYLYRHWSASGGLLYVGISLNAVARLSQHRHNAWFPQIAKVTIEAFDTYEAAEEAELRAICYEGPVHNATGPREAKDLGPALSRLRARQRRRGKSPTALTRRLAEHSCDVAFGIIPE